MTQKLLLNKISRTTRKNSSTYVRNWTTLISVRVLLVWSFPSSALQGQRPVYFCWRRRTTDRKRRWAKHIFSRNLTCRMGLIVSSFEKSSRELRIHLLNPLGRFFVQIGERLHDDGKSVVTLLVWNLHIFMFLFVYFTEFCIDNGRTLLSYIRFCHVKMCLYICKKLIAYLLHLTISSKHFPHVYAKLCIFMRYDSG